MLGHILIEPGLCRTDGGSPSIQGSMRYFSVKVAFPVENNLHFPSSNHVACWSVSWGMDMCSATIDVQAVPVKMNEGRGHTIHSGEANPASSGLEQRCTPIMTYHQS